MKKNTLSLHHFCRRCPNNCCTWGGPLITKGERDLILQEGYENAFKEEKSYFRITSGEHGGCFFLFKGICRIQKIKPKGCQAFPITKYYDLKSNKVKSGICNKCYASYILPKSFYFEALRIIKLVSDDQAQKWTDLSNYPVVDLIAPRRDI